MNFRIVDEFIGSRIMNKRIEKRYTVVEMAELCDLTRQGYYNYESGKTSMPSSTCIKICKHLGIDYIELMQEALDYARDVLMKEAVKEKMVSDVIDDVNSSDTNLNGKDIIDSFVSTLKKEDK